MLLAACTGMLSPVVLAFLELSTLVAIVLTTTGTVILHGDGVLSGGTSALIGEFEDGVG